MAGARNPILNHVRANVVAYLALFFALGGVAYAAASPLLDERDAIVHRHIAEGAVRGSDIDEGGVSEKQLDPAVQKQLLGAVALPASGTLSGATEDGSSRITIQIADRQIVDFGIEGECAWPVGTPGEYSAGGPSFVYSSEAIGGATLLAAGFVAPGARLVFTSVKTGDPDCQLDSTVTIQL